MMNAATKPVLLAALLGLAACAQPAPPVAPPVVDPYASTGGGAVFQGDLAGGVLGAEATAQYFQGTIGDTVLFPADQTTLTPEARAILSRQAAWLSRHMGFTAVVQGHAEETGTREYNLALGARRASAGPAAPWADATGRSFPEGESQRAVELACAYSGMAPGQVTGVTPITQFGGEYGFVHKRLPVIRVAFRAPEGDRLYVEPATGALSAWIRDRDAAEGKVFAAVHKLDWLASVIGKDPRNGVLSAVAFLQVTVIGLGLCLWALRRRRRA